MQRPIVQRSSAMNLQTLVELSLNGCVNYSQQLHCRRPHTEAASTSITATEILHTLRPKHLFYTKGN